MTRIATITVMMIFCASGCVVGPDGRRTLTPQARAVGEAMLEQVLRCGAEAGIAAAVSAAANGGPPSEDVLLDASRCHINVAVEQVKDALEVAPAPSVEHGRLIQRAHELEAEGLHEAAVEVARECDRKARGER